LKRRLARDTAGGFGTKRDYDGEEVLVTGRNLKAVPWALVRKVNTSEALAATESRLQVMLVVFLLVIGGTAVTVIAAWRHGTTIRAAEAGERHRIAAEHLGNLSKFLRVVTDGQPNAVTAMTEDGTFTFANLAVSEGTGINREDMRGKNMGQVWDSVKAKYYREFNQKIIDDREEILAGPKRVNHIKTFETEDDEQILGSFHIPLRPGRDFSPGCLMILDDITELVGQRKQRELIMDQLVDSLLSVVGQRDPYSQEHATRVSEVATTTAKEMQLTDEEVRTVGIAGKLMNLGKTLVPVELLIKSADLTDDELEPIRKRSVAAPIFSTESTSMGRWSIPFAKCKNAWMARGNPPV